MVSILSSRLKQATVHDLACLNKLAAHLRNTAQQCLVLHKFENKDMVFITASDAGGVDSLPIRERSNELQDTVQGAWVIMASNELPAADRKSKVSILSWRSTKLKWRVSSTLAGEALFFSQSLGEMEWLQVMFREIVYGDVCRKDWRSTLLPFIGLLREECELHEKLKECAKSLYDAILKNNPTSRQDRRTSIELAIISETMSKTKGLLRWSPHPKMIADALTKDDISKTNGALEEVLRTGRLCLWDEEAELLRRKDPKFRGRSKRASELIRQGGVNLLTLLDDLHVNNNLGALLIHTTCHEDLQSSN